MIKTTTLVIGGCKSGKSTHALALAHRVSVDKLSESSKIFVATSVPTDPEMQERVVAHKKERGKGWLTIEEPISLFEVIEEYSKKADIILVDCLTLWISNMLYKEYDKKKIFRCLEKLIQALNKAECSVILVSNEVGAGIVPENKLARKFRDIAGVVNQKIAQTVSNVVWIVAGIPVNIKESN